MTVSIVANGFLRNSPLFPLQKPAESRTIRPSACCTLNPAYQRNARDRTFTQSGIELPVYNEWSDDMFKRSLQLKKAPKNLRATTRNVMADIPTVVLPVVPRLLAGKT